VDSETGNGTKRLCDVCAIVTGTTGAGIMLMAGDVQRGSVCTTDAVAARIEQLQYTLGEGPCIDAHTQGKPVLEPDLADPAVPRWIAFSGPALDAGARAVFGFPLRIGAVRLGALNLYADRAGPLADDQHTYALSVADVAAEAVLLLQADAPPGILAAELEAGADFKYVVHQASGMVAAQLDMSVAQALIRLRAYAFANERTLTDVASAVVGQPLRFRTDDIDSGPNP
jgi:hypothetical protein